MTPWHLQRRPGAAIPSLALALAASLLAGCVTVTDQSTGPAGVVLAAQASQLPSATADRGAPASRPTSEDAAPRSAAPSLGGTATERARTFAPARLDPTDSPSTPSIGPSPLAARIPSEAPAETATPIETLAALATLPPTTAPSAIPSPSGAQIPSPSGVPVVSPSAPVDPTAVPPSHRHRSGGPSLGVATQRRLRAILDRTTGKGRIAGMQVAVRLPGGQTWLGQAGQAEFQPAPPSHRG